jgi:hypothetical protein
MTQEVDPVETDEGFILPLEPSIMVFTGAPKSGKTYLMKSLLYQYAQEKYFKFGLVFSGTAFTGQFSCIPDKYIKQEWDEKFLIDYLSRLQQLALKGNLQPSFLIIDDFIGKLVGSSSLVFQNLISTYRWYKLTIFMSSQYLAAGLATTLIRECATHAFMFHSHIKNSIKSLYESFGFQMKNQDEFQDFFNSATEEKYYCMLAVLTKTKKDETYFGFKADSYPEFKLKF